MESNVRESVAEGTEQEREMSNKPAEPLMEREHGSVIKEAATETSSTYCSVWASCTTR